MTNIKTTQAATKQAAKGVTLSKAEQLTADRQAKAKTAAITKSVACVALSISEAIKTLGKAQTAAAFAIKAAIVKSGFNAADCKAHKKAILALVVTEKDSSSTISRLWIASLWLVNNPKVDQSAFAAPVALWVATGQGGSVSELPQASRTSLELAGLSETVKAYDAKKATKPATVKKTVSTMPKGLFFDGLELSVSELASNPAMRKMLQALVKASNPAKLATVSTEQAANTEQAKKAA